MGCTDHISLELTDPRVTREGIQDLVIPSIDDIVCGGYSVCASFVGRWFESCRLVFIFYTCLGFFAFLKKSRELSEKMYSLFFVTPDTVESTVFAPYNKLNDHKSVFFKV